MINIAIDGPSSAGKSTIAKRLAKELNYIHLDTGAMYRCCALKAKLTNVNLDSDEELNELMNNIKISFDPSGNVYLDDKLVNNEIRTNDMSMLTSKISGYQIVREKLVSLQQNIAANKGYILDGRDIGTVVLKDAEVKIYLIASVETRAKRRYQEYIDQNIKADYEEIYKDIEQRDYQDTHREISPLQKANDAIEVDSSYLSIDEVVKEIMQIINKKL